MCRRSASVLRPRLAIRVRSGCGAAHIDDRRRRRDRRRSTELVDGDGLLGYHVPVGLERDRIDWDFADIVRLHELEETFRRPMLIEAKIADRLAHLRQILP